HDTTMDEIAVAMGIAKGTLYYNFKNKEDLYFALIKEGIEILKKKVSEAIDKANEPEEQLKQIIKAQYCYFQNYANVTFIFLRELYGNIIGRDTLSNLLKEYLSLIAGVLEGGIRKGKFKPMDIEATTSMVFGIISTTALHYLNIHGNIPLEMVQDITAEMIFKGILSESTV
ncbi:MAG: TetR/AcrR family transcriptional regulator, partial [Firmicutes bacterium]|nr:TetR/AcrR family transcriptional regulator [Bacillota bacterium]